jgi:flagellar biosynthetic protein FliR
MELIEQLTNPNTVVSFMLLFARMSGIIAFFPFFNHQSFPVSIKTALAFYLCLMFLPVLPPVEYNFTYMGLMIAVLGEVMLGFLASIFLQIAFAIIHFAGQTISFSMGFSMATTFDPMAGTNTTVIGQLLTLTATLFMIIQGMDHMILLFLDKSFESVPLGGFMFDRDVVPFMIKAATSIFVLGFALAFPVAGLILLTDILFGMIMKTNPQFNLLVFGFPLKIMVSFIILILTVHGFMIVFEKHFLDLFDKLMLFL